nr:hypothetical protein Iba_chr01cCG4800 [Ipomoea batatas]
MEIVVVPETVDATGNPGMGSVEVVAETPLEEQEAINHVEPEMEQSMEVVLETPSAMAGLQGPAMSPPASATINASKPPLSYADMVSGDVTSHNTNQVQPSSKDGGISAARVESKGGNPYGPSMIVTRRERRQHERPARSGRAVEAGRKKENTSNGNIKGQN